MTVRKGQVCRGLSAADVCRDMWRVTTPASGEGQSWYPPIVCGEQTAVTSVFMFVPFSLLLTKLRSTSGGEWAAASRREASVTRKFNDPYLLDGLVTIIRAVWFLSLFFPVSVYLRLCAPSMVVLRQPISRFSRSISETLTKSYI